jgi:plastocyanin
MPPADALAVSVLDFMIDPAELEVTGPTVTIAVTNDGPTPHNLTVRDAAGDVIIGTDDLGVGESETISGELEPGDYTIFCALAGHESLGMSGTLTVTAP